MPERVRTRPEPSETCAGTSRDMAETSETRQNLHRNFPPQPPLVQNLPQPAEPPGTCTRTSRNLSRCCGTCRNPRGSARNLRRNLHPRPEPSGSRAGCSPFQNALPFRSVPEPPGTSLAPEPPTTPQTATTRLEPPGTRPEPAPTPSPPLTTEDPMHSAVGDKLHR